MAAQLSELLIKINADAKNATKAFDDVKDKTDDLESNLSDVAKISSVAFAALTAEVFLSVKAFQEADLATKQLNLALQNQGIYTDDLAASYKNYANAVSEATGIDDDAITKAQSLAQVYLGQTKITQELTQAIADYGAKTGSIDDAATKIAKTIGTSTNAFAREGLVLSATATEAERYTKVLEFVNSRNKDVAALANQAGGGIIGLQTAFGNFQENIGSKFAPAFALVVKGLTDLFKFFARNDEISNLVVALIAGAGAVAAMGIAIPAVVIAWTTFTAATAAAGIAVNVALLGIPLLIGAVVAAVVFLATNWGNNMALVKAATVSMVNLVSNLLGGLGTLLQGVFVFDIGKVKAGLAAIGASFGKAKDDYIAIKAQETTAVVKEITTQDAAKKAQADKELAAKKAHNEALLNLEKANQALILLQINNASQAQIELKTKEIAILKGLTEQKSTQELALLRERRAQIVALEDEQRAEDIARNSEFALASLDAQQSALEQGQSARFDLRQEENAAIEASALTELGAQRKLGADKLKAQVEEQNLRKIETAKFGTTIAAVNAALRSDEVQGAKAVGNELVALGQSKNAALKAIGKAAAISQITIATAESAVTIAQQVSKVIPFPFSVPIAAALVGARIAFGAEQIGKVVGAAEGGLIEGGTSGVDSVPALLSPGELVVPRRNFNDVVGAASGGGQDNSAVIAAIQSLEASLAARPTTVINGDVQADESYIDALIKKISDAVEFRNAQIVGVNA